MIEPIFRMVPRLDELNTPFWTGGAEGELRIQRCNVCGYWIHPPTIVCPACLSRDVGPDVVSGLGRLTSFGIMHLEAHEGVPIPYIQALVELDEQPALRVVSNLVNCQPSEARVDMRVQVAFEQHGEVFVPVFEPVTS